LRARDSRVDIGGKGFNVSRALRELGISSTAMGFTGGKTGEILEEGLHNLGIGTDFVHISGETRTNTSLVSQGSMDYLKVNESGPAITQNEMDRILNKISALAHENDWWVLSGSLPLGLAPVFYAQLVQVIQSAKAKAVLDSSGETLRLGCNAGPTLIKPNADELANLTGLEVGSCDDALKAIEAAHQMGANWILLSLGADGAMLSNGLQVWQARAPAIAEVNPIGAGDALLAGFLAGLVWGKELPEGLRWAVATGAAAASLGGTSFGSLEYVSSLFKHTISFEIQNS
jgi:1-phosphofructokinase family hexose kinase